MATAMALVPLNCYWMLMDCDQFVVIEQSEEKAKQALRECYGVQDEDPEWEVKVLESYPCTQGFIFRLDDS